MKGPVSYLCDVVIPRNKIWRFLVSFLKYLCNENVFMLEV